MRVDRLYRYPVKGLTAEALDEAELETGRGLPWDRAFAVLLDNAPFDPEAPAWLLKTHFLALVTHARAAAYRASFDPRSGLLDLVAPDGTAITDRPLTEPGRQRLAAFIAATLGEATPAPPRLVHAAGHSFENQKKKVVSLINLASLAELERHAGAPRQKRRFRANVYFSGAPALRELEWVGRELMLGTARLRVVKRTVRCAATEVNPQTAQRDADPVAELRAAYGHADLGVHAEVIEPGRVAVGDALALLPE